MKALSIQQPWAYCITNGTKRVENRTWYTAYRGPLLIHAGKKRQVDIEFAIHEDSPEMDIVGMRRAPRGAIVGVCWLADCIRPGDDVRVPKDQRVWADPSQYKFLVTDVREFRFPIPYIGQLGIFEIPDDIVRAALEAVA